MVFYCKKSLFCLAALFSLNVCAAFEDDPEPTEKKRQEIEVVFPGFPETANLIPFQVGAIRDPQFFIDGQSITVDIDGNPRFTLVIISAAGAQTISYEEMRCDTGERRAYAFGRADKTWSIPRNSKWLKVPPGANLYAELYGNYFCPIARPSLKSADDARRALRYPGRN